jgi:superfamily II DNA/RNA helicase
MSFEALGLHTSIVQAVSAAGYEKPTPVQEQAVPAGIAGRDMLVSSQTGSGKTAAFMLPALNKFANEEVVAGGRTSAQDAQAAKARGERVRFKPAQPKMLVLTPTRELALQVTSATEQYTAFMRRIRAVSILGGMPYPKQMQLLAKNPEILVATPGRLIDHMESGKIDFSQLEILVLDEADRMLDMGFIEDIETIISRLPEDRQTLLFSATLDGTVAKLAAKMMRDPQRIEIAGAKEKHSNITQSLLYADDSSHKMQLLDHVLRDAKLDQAIVFTSTKRGADDLAGRLADQGFAAAALHGDMNQRQRTRTLGMLQRGQLRVLVATDVAARGLDIKSLELVVNYELAWDPEVHVHRIGRTARAGNSGLAISFCAPEEAQRANILAEMLQIKLNWVDAPANVSVVPLVAGMATLCIDGGKKAKMRPGDVLGALTGDIGLDGADIGKIAVHPAHVYVAVRQSVAQKAWKQLQNGKIKGKTCKVRLLK